MTDETLQEWYDKPWREPEEPGSLLELVAFIREQTNLGHRLDHLDLTEIAVTSKVKTCLSCWWNSCEGMEIPCNHTKEKKAGMFACCPQWQGVVRR